MVVVLKKGVLLKVENVNFTNGKISKVVKNILDMEIGTIYRLGEGTTNLILEDINNKNNYSITPNIVKIEKTKDIIEFHFTDVSYKFKVLKERMGK